MEPKLIKEETSEKEVSAYSDTSNSIRTRNKVNGKESSTQPDSPEGTRINQLSALSPSQSSPVRHPVNGSSSPVHNGSIDSITPPPNSLPLTVNLEPNPAHNWSPGSQHYRPLSKLKRFLSTLVQFGESISPDVGEKIRNLVLNLVSSSMTTEEFHHSLQDVTNFPLRPFVLPFLKTHLPPLQREVHNLSRTAKQTPLQYLRAHEHLALETAHSPTEPSEIFLSASESSISSSGIKRRASDALYENGLNTLEPSEYLPKRSYSSHNWLTQQVLGSQTNTTLDWNHGSLPPTCSSSITGHLSSQSSQQRPTLDEGRGDEEWKNIHVMLNCILSMVEKTKRALSILQNRNSQDFTTDWFRKQDVGIDLRKTANEIMAQAVRQTEDRVAEVKRRAEEAVNEVKRQAVLELQKAVTAAEIKANELVAQERAKMEKLLIESRKHSTEPMNNESTENSQSPPVSTQTMPSQQNSCWNCGRKAHETCSGCSIARYCGSFCQHKDWENHHQVCNNREKSRSQQTSTPSSLPVSATVLPSASPDQTRLKK